MPAIVRALTTRKVKMSLELAQEARERAAMQRSNTTKPIGGRSDTARSQPSRSNSVANSGVRPKISGPIELIHTTNMLSYNAPDLPRPSTSNSNQSSSRSVAHTDDESDSSPSTAASSPPTSPDVPSSELKRSVSPEPNHLSCYFLPPQIPQVPSASTVQAPAIPKRAPSHTKQASIDAMSRQRSMSHLSKDSGRSMSRGQYSFSRSASTATSFSGMSRDSVQTHSTGISSTMSISPMSPPAEKTQYANPQHPFGLELAQVTEIAEEFGVGNRLDAIDEEEQELLSRGLCKVSADVYLNDIQNLASFFFHDRDVTHARPVPAVWI
ncbi:hypothetical protein jhhlp_002347 [Lomentospora prolificans]|uniref:Uncharacterized protein n=1 Tax=Lomentospora prolificans TaxID=41688 RepID=A0A2N3NDU7_9PEZI|nr:hypothetical protein jhhlp_002347 [Lomentospora prolificans]